MDFDIVYPLFFLASKKFRLMSDLSIFFSNQKFYFIKHESLTDWASAACSISESHFTKLVLMYPVYRRFELRGSKVKLNPNNRNLNLLPAILY